MRLYFTDSIAALSITAGIIHQNISAYICDYGALAIQAATFGIWAFITIKRYHNDKKKGKNNAK